MITKYGFEVSKAIMLENKKRLINQLWKVLPMREKNEDWEKQLTSVIDELIGLNEVFCQQIDFLILLSKLECLFQIKDFMSFRKTIFESISLLDGLYD